MALTLEVRHLELVAAIAKTRSVARAADELHLSQPALSHALRNLEDRLGVRLFERARRMTLTPAGAELNDAALRILGDIRAAESRVKRHAKTLPRVIRVATECYTCYHWLPTVLKRLRSAVPGVTIRAAGEAMPKALDALLNGELDLALLHFKPANRRLAIERLFTDEQVLIVPAGHPLASRRFVRPEDLRDEHLLAHRAPEQTAFWKSFLDPAGVKPLDRTSLHTTQAVVESVKAGLGVAAIARWAVADALDGGDIRAVRIGQSGQQRSWYAATLGGRMDDQARAVVDALRGLSAAAPTQSATARR